MTKKGPKRLFLSPPHTGGEELKSAKKANVIVFPKVL